MEAETYCLNCMHKKKVCWWYPRKGCKELLTVEPLTDEEQRLFLTAIDKEKKLCKNIEEIWEQLNLSSNDDIDLVKACEEIERKVKKTLWS